MASEKNIGQVRDEVATLLGWSMVSEQDEGVPHWQNASGVDLYMIDEDAVHPIPDTLGGVLALLPEGWEWQRFRMEDTNTMWEATKVKNGQLRGRATVLDTGDHVADATRLVHAALEAKGKA